MNHAPIDQMLKRDRIIVALCLFGVTAIAWIYMFSLAGGRMSTDPRTQMYGPHMHAWDSLNLLLIFTMWSIMMAAMMLPSELQIILMFAAVNRKRCQQRYPLVLTSMFLLGYLAAWTAFSALATLAQWGLHTVRLLSSMMEINNSILGGAILFAAGVFQWTPLKYACLTRCRSPLSFLMNEWREGTGGAVLMGLKRGIYCIGCCWLLMSLMFVTGVMNLLWMAIITVFVLLEKIVPGGFWVSRIAGLLLALWGTWMAWGALLSHI